MGEMSISWAELINLSASEKPIIGFYSTSALFLPLCLGSAYWTGTLMQPLPPTNQFAIFALLQSPLKNAIERIPISIYPKRANSQIRCNAPKMV